MWIARSLILLLIFFIFVSLPGLAQKQILVPGKSAGIVELGTDYNTCKTQLGAPTKVESSLSDPSTKLYRHNDMYVLVGKSNSVIGITVISPSFKTPEGFGIGSGDNQITARYGPGLQRGAGNRTYPTRGIGFSYDASSKVSQVYIFRTEGERPLLGDRLLMPGQRAGELRLGMKLSAVEKAWGQPTKTTPMGQGRTLVEYAQSSVRFVVQEGIVDAILVATGDFITPQGLKVGSSAMEVQSILGQSRSKNKKGLFYPKLGIGFLTESNQVTEVQILSPK
jgi:hypothetical protein